jgi:hypothetical protein
MAGGELFGKLAGAPGSAAGAAHTLTAMLDDPDRDHRQLFDLMVCGLAHRHPVRLAKDVSTPAQAGPMVDDLVHRPRWQQRPPTTLMAGLPTRFAPRTILPASRRAPRRIRARRP